MTYWFIQTARNDIISEGTKKDGIFYLKNPLILDLMSYTSFKLIPLVPLTAKINLNIEANQTLFATTEISPLLINIYKKSLQSISETINLINIEEENDEYNKTTIIKKGLKNLN